MKRVWIGLGSNLGDREKNLVFARTSLVQTGCKIVKLSSVYETEPWGFESANAFLNQCLEMETDLVPEILLVKLKEIEFDAGRRYESSRYSDRILDLDILFYSSLILESEQLKIPHPGIAHRNFVLLPLCEIAPDLIHPGTGQSTSEMLEASSDEQKVKLFTSA